MSHVDVKNMKPTNFEDEYYDQYEYYNLSDKYTGEKMFLRLLNDWSEFTQFCLFACLFVKVPVFVVCRGLGP